MPLCFNEHFASISDAPWSQRGAITFPPYDTIFMTLKKSRDSRRLSSEAFLSTPHGIRINRHLAGNNPFMMAKGSETPHVLLRWNVV